ncbi:Homeodomain-like protein [Linnemannia elongata]|nr:Homeodomain-like protein [Linnemannia elongata]
MTLSIGEQGEIVGMWKSGRTPAEIARSVGQSRATVGNVIKRYRERGNYEPRKSPGRPKKLDARAVRQVVSIAKRNRRSTLTDITNQLPVEVSRSTVMRTLHRERIFSRVAIVKP